MYYLLIILLILIIICANYINVIENMEDNNDNNNDDNKKKITDYDPDNLDVDYIDETKILENSDNNSGKAWVKDADGNMVALSTEGSLLEKQINLANNINYYEPGTYKYGPSMYIPSYEDSVFLSKTTGKSSVTEYINEATIRNGICTHYKDFPDKLEEECSKLDKNICGSTDCCVLLGGSKCVSGNAQGPTSKLNYGDITVRNRDFYYYKGKCYGNCQPTK